MIHVTVSTTTSNVTVKTPPIINTELIDVYDGEYVVEPDIEPIVLKTKAKSMSDDVTVKKIPVWETSNDAGGTTCLIGGEKYYGI